MSPSDENKYFKVCKNKLVSIKSKAYQETDDA